MEASPNTRRVPVLVDSRLNTAFMIKYIIYAVFGLLGAISGTPTVEAVAGLTVARTVAAFICVGAIVAAVAVKYSIKSRVWKRIELYATWVVISFVSVYFISAVILAFQGDRGRVSAGMLALGLIVLPIWRIGWLIKELRE
jgi:glucan phosphoethanolaminetransferase (alkaline phosphatase superfamily)